MKAICKFLPAFPPKGFTWEDAQNLNNLITESELQELDKVRQLIKPFLKDIPRECLTVSERVNYLINKP